MLGANTCVCVRQRVTEEIERFINVHVRDERDRDGEREGKGKGAYVFMWEHERKPVSMVDS